MSSLRLLPLLTSVFAVASVRGVGLPPASPEAMAAEVRALVSSGAGALMPDLDRAYIADGGLVPLGEGDFPAMFLHGLVAEWRDGLGPLPPRTTPPRRLFPRPASMHCGDHRRDRPRAIFIVGNDHADIGIYSLDAPSAITNGVQFLHVLYQTLTDYSE